MREVSRNSDKKEENCKMEESEKKSQRAVMQNVKLKLSSNGCIYIDREIMMKSTTTTITTTAATKSNINNNSRVVKGSYHNSRVELFPFYQYISFINIFHLSIYFIYQYIYIHHNLNFCCLITLGNQADPGSLHILRTLKIPPQGAL